MAQTLTDTISDATPVHSNAGSLYRQYVQLVARWVARLGGPEIDVEDAVQEIFLVAHQRPFEFRGEAQVTTWLFRIAQRVVMHQARKQKWRRWLRGSSMEAAGDLPWSGPSPIDEYERREATRTTYRVLKGLSEKHRTTFVLFELEGLPGEEIARLTGTTVANVWVRLHRARAQFLRGVSALEGRRS